MKFQIGDKVLVLHSNEEGEVVDIINNKMVMVDVRGVKFPAYIDQLDFPYFKRFTEKKLVPSKKEKQFIDQLKKEKSVSSNQVEDGVWILFLPKFDMDEFGDDVVESIKIHLVNHTRNGYQFTYNLSFFGKPEFELKNEVLAFKDFYVHDIPFEDMSDSPLFAFDFSLLTPNKNKADHFESSVKLKPKQLFAKIEEIKQKGEASFSFLLFDEFPDKPVEDTFDLGHLAAKGFKIYDAKQARQHLEPARSLIDLHIEKITDDYSHLSNFEKLSLQLQMLEKYLDLAVAHHLRSMTVIHGVGSGKLKDEIHEILKLRDDVNSFINQYDPRYGYGATEVFFK
ncbi:MAG TPA: Smr/MutS family protein [Chitinophagaceae bacterium]|nr:Smr/MutS family protein [Chitinophagaceae bacterium]